MAAVRLFFMVKCRLLGRKFTSLMADTAGHERARTDETDAVACFTSDSAVSASGIDAAQAQMN